MESIEIKLRQAVDAFNKGNYQFSFDIFKPLAEEGNAKAQFYLGFLYRIGQAVNQDYDQAYRWYLLSANQGSAEAQYKIGLLMYYKGQVVKKNFQKAFDWYSLAAEQGEMMAQSNLGHLYANEQTGKLDYIQAHK